LLAGTNFSDSNSSIRFVFRLELVVKKPSWTPSLVPQDGDPWTYLVADRCRKRGCFYKETSAEQSSLEQVIIDMAEGQFVDPLRVVGFSVQEGRARDVSTDVARHVANYAHLRGRVLPESIREFVERHTQSSKKSA
jgi:hypothetical protein